MASLTQLFVPLGFRPLFVFVIVYCVASSSNWGQIPAFRDMQMDGATSLQAQFNDINGLRGLAAILVLLSHAAPGWHDLQVGLSLLFVISGFLLTKPFVVDTNRIFSASTIKGFWVKRIKRILPMYFLFVFCSYAFSHQFDTLIRHLIFIEARGHLWPMTQIFAFYMLLPLILLVTSALAKVHKLLVIVALYASIYLYIPISLWWKPFYNGDYHHEFFLYSFLLGVLVSYLQYGYIQPWKDAYGAISSRVNQSMGVIALIFSVTFILWSGPYKPAPIINGYLSVFVVKNLACAAMILFMLNTHRTCFNFVLSNTLFRSVGVIGFSFYILHGLGIDISKQLIFDYANFSVSSSGSWTVATIAFIVTYFMAAITYSYVERPFFGRSRPPLVRS